VTTKRKKKGIVVTARRGHNLCLVAPSRRTEPAPVCYHWLVRAGLKPLKPGESRKVRIIVEDAP